jgi:ppGpp synthetase/RelA/SpoT-type nucleotidyltranferase
MEDRPETKGTSSFHVVVEAADRLTPDEQETLVEILNRRLAVRRRAELVADIREAEREFERDALRPTIPDEIMKELLS